MTTAIGTPANVLFSQTEMGKKYLDEKRDGVLVFHGFAMSQEQMRSMDGHMRMLLEKMGGRIKELKTDEEKEQYDPYELLDNILLSPKYRDVGETWIILKDRWKEFEPTGFEGKRILLCVFMSEEPGTLRNVPILELDPEDEETKRAMDWLLDAGLTEEEVRRMWVTVPYYYLDFKGFGLYRDAQPE